jgi:SAM-dependent methyltransferase
MSFDAGADAYARFMGRYSGPLAAALVARLSLRAGQRVIDVGCGSGVLTEAVLDVVGKDHVVAVDPEPTLALAVRTTVTNKVAIAEAERLPFGNAVFDVALAQLVVPFMRDPVAGLTEMARVTAVGGVVAASAWDLGGGLGPLGTFWRAVHDLDPNAVDESTRAGVRAGDLCDLVGKAGLTITMNTSLTVTVEHSSFEDWWDPFLLGVGPAGSYVAGLSHDGEEELREHCRELQPRDSFTVDALAWTVIAEAG